jgi:hypothetical protein
MEPVYNVRVADHHTYFVGDREWGFSVWAHNLCAITRYGPTWNRRVRGSSGATVFGTSQNTRGRHFRHGLNQHQVYVQRQMYRVVNNQPFTDGTRTYTFSMNSNSYVTVNRNLRTSLGGPISLPGGGTGRITFGPGANLRPDAVVVEQISPTQFRVSMIEVQSPGQPPGALLARMRTAWAALRFPPGVTVDKGAFIVTNTTGTPLIVDL